MRRLKFILALWLLGCTFVLMGLKCPWQEDDNVITGSSGPGSPWTIINMTNGPLANPTIACSAIWTGAEMIIWGGWDIELGVYTNTGFKYNPINNAWTSITTTNAPVSRTRHSAIWTGSPADGGRGEMIIWGGRNQIGLRVNTGAKYYPITDTWVAITTTNAPLSRSNASAIWTGREMIIWGGEDGLANLLTDGSKYNPISDTWTSITTTGAPSARSRPSAVWTGTKMFIWGGYFNNSVRGDGAMYDPKTDTWTPITSTNIPSARSDQSTIWTGTEVIIWGGHNLYDPLNTGAKYNPLTDTWTPITMDGAPEARSGHTAVWTGSEMVIWGGQGNPQSIYYNNGFRYNPATDKWTPIPIAPLLLRWLSVSFWTGSEMLIWGGNNGVTWFNDGGRYKP